MALAALTYPLPSSAPRTCPISSRLPSRPVCLLHLALSKRLSRLVPRRVTGQGNSTSSRSWEAYQHSRSTATHFHFHPTVELGNQGAQRVPRPGLLGACPVRSFASRPDFLLLSLPFTSFLEHFPRTSSKQTIPGRSHIPLHSLSNFPSVLSVH